MFTWDESFDEEALFNLSNLQALSSQDSFSYGVGVIFYCKTSWWSLINLGLLIARFSFKIFKEVWLLLSKLITNGSSFGSGIMKKWVNGKAISLGK